MKDNIRGRSGKWRRREQTCGGRKWTLGNCLWKSKLLKNLEIKSQNPKRKKPK